MDNSANRLFLEGEEDEGAIRVLEVGGDARIVGVGEVFEPKEDVFRTEAGDFINERWGAFYRQC